MKHQLVAVVLAGGTGTRLYPATRADRPKQFLSFGGEESLLARTVERAAFADAVFVSTGPALANAVSDHARDAEILCEPSPRDTGPALVYAAHVLRERFGDSVLLCLPSDHHVAGEFEATARQAAALAAETEDLVTIGVEPNRPATGYGYVLPGESVGSGYAIEQFIEKPGRDRARDLIAEGALWNAGMFTWTPDALLREAEQSVLAPLVDALSAGDPEGGFEAIDPTSIDHAVLEDTDRAVVVPAGFEWDDLGTWNAVGRVASAPLADVIEIDAAGNVLASDGAHLTVVGVSDLVVAAYDDRVLVVPTAQAQRVREAVDRLRKQGRY